MYPCNPQYCCRYAVCVLQLCNRRAAKPGTCLPVWHNLHSVVQEIKKLNCKASVAINPHTSVDLLKDILPDLDVVLIMSVNPGFGGQVFLEHTYDKVRALKKLIEERKLNCQIEIDGGVTDQNAAALLEAGADILVAGSFVFRSNDPLSTISGLKAL